MDQKTEKRKLLIIKSHPQSLGPVEGFLKNREWEIKSTHNLKEAMVFLVQNQPQFVMVSIDHPNKKVRNLPKVLSQAFPVCVIAFAEHSTPSSVKILNDCNSGYAIYHPITGPAVERMVNKYNKDQMANPQAAAANRSWDGNGGNGSGVIAIRGGEAGGDASATSTQNFLANLMGALDSGATSGNLAGFAQGTAADGTMTAVQPGMAGFAGQAEQNAMNGFSSGSNQESENGAHGFMGGQQNGMNGAGGNAAQNGFGGFNDGAIGNGFNPNSFGTNGANGMDPNFPDPNGSNGFANGNGKNSSAHGMNGGFGSDFNHNSSPSADGGSATNPHAPGFMGPSGSAAASDTLDPNDPNYDPYGDGGEASYSSRKKSDTMWAPLGADGKNKKQHVLKETADEVAKDPGSLILKGTREAMDKACVITEKKRNVGIATNVACILVESGRFSGYLVAAMAEHLTIDIHFVEKIRTRLFKFLSENGENLENNETMPIKIKQVPFAAWAVEHAEFLRKSVHKGNEVAMAFFPRPDLKAEISASPDEEMAAVKIHEMRTDVPVDFNLYVHLPRNNRYVLYTPEGGVFLSEQKTRLVNQGITHLHVLRMELQNLDKYRAQNYLNDKIDQYQEQLEKEAKDTKKPLAS
ncbi:hypothetical protein [Bdellovibrio sp. KM01]|uniref:hypothetical protein n=1 Tax=Bdellovibrio sp. KM01 TaxID=2748865 RepID=UPI0015EA3FDC|nr:hypothetical protein [Bdellovibrio sp. KM01]QLY24447.1 hypothetical protein HW988_13390 [Bdellovibrio sp. KM01]